MAKIKICVESKQCDKKYTQKLNRNYFMYFFLRKWQLFEGGFKLDLTHYIIFEIHKNNK